MLTYKLPATELAHIPYSPMKPADVARPPSPTTEDDPIPAYVLIIPEERDRMRMVNVPASAMNRLLEVSQNKFFVKPTCALVPCPPSPVHPEMPVPTTVVMIPVETAILRMRQSVPLSLLIYILPETSKTSPSELVIPAETAGPPSPELVVAPVPTTVFIWGGKANTKDGFAVGVTVGTKVGRTVGIAVG